MRVILIAMACLGAAWAQSYVGPKPARPDLPYLRHATQLIALEVAEAREEKRKEGTAYVSAGAASPTRTPMAEPVFLFESKSIPAEKLTLYKLDVKASNREVFFFDNPKKRRDSARPLRLTVTRLALEERNLLDIQASILHLQKLELLRSTALFSKTEILEHSGDDHGRTTENCHGSHHPSGCYFGLRGETRRRF